MKKLYYFIFIFTHYVSLAVESFLYFDIVNLTLITYLIIVNTLLIGKKKMDKFSTTVFLVNSLLLYPIIVFKVGGTSDLLLIVLISIIMVFVFISNNYYSFNREVLLFLLIVLTLNSSVLSLYISVYENKCMSLIFIGIVNFLCFTSTNSTKLIKKVNKRAKKIKGDV